MLNSRRSAVERAMPKNADCTQSKRGGFFVANSRTIQNSSNDLKTVSENCISKL